MRIYEYQMRYIDPKKLKIEKHIDYCEYMVDYCNRKSNNLKSHYFKKQIELSKRLLKKKNRV